MDLPITRRGMDAAARGGDYCCNNSRNRRSPRSAARSAASNAQKFPCDTLRGTIEGSLFERVKKTAARNAAPCSGAAHCLSAAACPLELTKRYRRWNSDGRTEFAWRSPLVAIASTSCPCEASSRGVTFTERAQNQAVASRCSRPSELHFGSLVRALDLPREINRFLIEAQFNLERIEQNLHFEILLSRPTPIQALCEF